MQEHFHLMWQIKELWITLIRLAIKWVPVTKAWYFSECRWRNSLQYWG